MNTNAFQRYCSWKYQLKMGGLLSRCIYFETVIHNTDDNVLEDSCDIDDDDDIDEDDDSWSNRAVYGSIENNVGMIEFIYFILL